MKSIRWHFRIPGMTYALDVVFRQAVNKTEAREYILAAYFRGKRIPHGFEIWPAK